MKHSIIKACFSALGIMHSILRKMKYNPYSITTYSEDPNKKSHLFYLEISSIRTGLFWSELLLIFLLSRWTIISDRQTEFWIFRKKSCKIKEIFRKSSNFWSELLLIWKNLPAEVRTIIIQIRPIFVRIFSKLSRVVLLDF